MTSCTGGIATLSILCIVFAFAMLKLKHMVEFKNPSIATFDQEIEASQDNSFRLDDSSFMFAFGIDTYGGSTKNDERYLKWIARYKIVTVEGETIERYVPVHNCTEEDFDKLYAP